MQNEITKHTKKIFKEMKNSKHTFGEKVKEIIIEILIIVFAVTLSIWLHSWSLERHQEKEVNAFLINLNNDLQNDIKVLDAEKEKYEKTNLGYEKILELTAFQLDSIRKVKKFNFPVHSHGPKFNIGNYEGFKSSGKIGYIKDEQLKLKIIQYYQIFVPSINEADKIYNDYIFKCLDKIIDNADKSEDKIYADPKLKKMIFLLITIGKNNIRVYDEIGKTEAKELIKEINNKMKQ